MRAGSVPLLVVSPSTGSPPFATVLWFHGLGVSKNTHEKELQQLADAGFLAVGVDAAGHGERELPTLKQRIAEGSQDEALRLMLPLAELTARDVPLVVRTLVEEGLTDERRVALAGISMGAYVVYRAVAIVQGIRAAIALLGSPDWPEGISPHSDPAAFRSTALLSITAERDVNVPPDAARAFHDMLDEDGERTAPARYLELSGASHLMSEGDWARAITETVAWLRRYNA
jgi:dipeptidyl aminopeptidase/acylaminoacyl peptidase